jgi:peroxiredoxin
MGNMMNKKVMMLAVMLFMGAVTELKAQVAEEDLDAKYATELVKPGTEAPDFGLKTPEGTIFRLSSLRGKIVVLDFWASWCSDCRKDAPEIVRLYNTYHPQGVEFVGVSMDTNVEAWQKAIKQYGIEYLQVSELKKFKETDISRAYGINWIPSLVVIGKDGKVLLSTVLSEKVGTLLNDILNNK